MFLRLISANLRGSLSICTARNVLIKQLTWQPRIIISSNSTVYYSTEKAASSFPINTIEAANQNEQLSKDEIKMLNDNPDSFGTLSSFTSPVVKQEKENKNTRDIKEKIEKSRINKKSKTKQRLPVQNWSEEHETLLKNVIQGKGIHAAVEIFEKEMLKKNRVLANAEIFEWLIFECLRVHVYDKAFSLYDHMINRAMKVSFSTLEKLTLALEASGIKKVHTIRKNMMKYNYKPNATMYNIFIRIYNGDRNWQKAIKLANEMKENGFIYEHETINSLIECCQYDETNGFIRMLELWHELLLLGYTPNVFTLNGILKTCVACQVNDANQLEETVQTIQTKYKELFSETENYKPKERIDDGKPNLLIIPPYVGHLFPLNNVKTPEHRLLILGGTTEILELIKECDITPTLDTCHLLLSITPNTFDAQQRVLRLFTKHSIVPSVDIFNLLLMKVCMRQNFNDAQEVIEMMRSFDVEVNILTYALFAMVCKTQQETEILFVEADSNNIELDTNILNAMLKNACATKDNNFVISILRRMQTNNVEPSKESIEMMEKYQNEVYKNLRKLRKLDKTARNESFKMMRECKQWFKHFQLDKQVLDILEKPIQKVAKKIERKKRISVKSRKTQYRQKNRARK